MIEAKDLAPAIHAVLSIWTAFSVDSERLIEASQRMFQNITAGLAGRFIPFLERRKSYISVRGKYQSR